MFEQVFTMTGDSLREECAKNLLEILFRMPQRRCRRLIKFLCVLRNDDKEPNPNMWHIMSFSSYLETFFLCYFFAKRIQKKSFVQGSFWVKQSSTESHSRGNTDLFRRWLLTIVNVLCILKQYTCVFCMFDVWLNRILCLLRYVLINIFLCWNTVKQPFICQPHTQLLESQNKSLSCKEVHVMACCQWEEGSAWSYSKQIRKKGTATHKSVWFWPFVLLYDVIIVCFGRRSNYMCDYLCINTPLLYMNTKN